MTNSFDWHKDEMATEMEETAAGMEASHRESDGEEYEDPIFISKRISTSRYL